MMTTEQLAELIRGYLDPLSLASMPKNGCENLADFILRKMDEEVQEAMKRLSRESLDRALDKGEG